jgi:EAL domain-containing protein (putative c-di-GMP-specific phosphodiesterase class I)/GGDEF domain-containing protein
MMLEQVIAQPPAAHPGSGLLLVALDGTAELAQRLGPGGLDLLRQALGLRLREQLEPTDLAACLDDHYHALLLRRPGPDTLLEAVTRLRETLAVTPLTLAGQSIGVRLSIGLGLLRTSPGDALTLISWAQMACAAAQQSGGDRLVIYQPSAPGPEDVFHEQRLDQLIAQALIGSTPGQGFRLFYQPLAAVGPQGRHCLQVLLRLAEEDGTLIPSWDFLPIAERCGRTVSIDRWVMMHSLAVLAEQSQAQPGLELLIRQHLETLAAPGWILWLRDQLSTQGLTPAAAILGLTVPDLLQHRGIAVLVAKMLRRLGIGICLLEVDQTPAALDLVMELRPPLVRLAADTVREATPERLNALVRRLRLQEAEVIAAGLDDPALIGPVWASGVRYAQGTLIQPPLAQPVFDWDEVVVG